MDSTKTIYSKIYKQSSGGDTEPVDDFYRVYGYYIILDDVVKITNMNWVAVNNMPFYDVLDIYNYFLIKRERENRELKKRQKGL